MSESKSAPQTIRIDERDVEVVRVQEVASKHEYSITKDRADELGDAVKVLDKPAVDLRGQLLPAKPHRPKGDTATSQGHAPTSKEASK